jgi:hypothetical protein
MGTNLSERASAFTFLAVDLCWYKYTNMHDFTTGILQCECSLYWESHSSQHTVTVIRECKACLCLGKVVCLSSPVAVFVLHLRKCWKNCIIFGTGGTCLNTWRLFLSSILTYLRSWALLEEPVIVQPLKNFPKFYGTLVPVLSHINPIHTILSKINFNIVHPPTPQPGSDSSPKNFMLLVFRGL